MKDEIVIEAIKNGDEAAINDVIERYFKLIWSIASPILKSVASTQDIEECVADVFVYLWENPGKYDAQRGKLKAWLSAVARSRAINQYRRITRRRDIPLEEAPFAQSPDLVEGEVLAGESRQALAAAVRALEEPEREILIRRYYYGQKPKEISAALAMPVKHIENHIYRGKQRLKRMITDGGAQ